MANKILKKKLLFCFHLQHLSHDSLAWEIAEVQKKLKLPGLISECCNIISELNLPEAEKCAKLQWKRIINKAVVEKNRSELLDSIGDLKKLDQNELKNEEFELKPYLMELNMNDVRTKFSIRKRW